MTQDAIPPSSFKMDMSPPGSQVKIWTTCISHATVRGEGPRKCRVRSVLRMTQDAIPPSTFKMDMSPPGSQVKVWTTFITFLTSHVREERRGECHGNGQGQPQAGSAGTAQRHDSLWRPGGWLKPSVSLSKQAETFTMAAMWQQILRSCNHFVPHRQHVWPNQNWLGKPEAAPRRSKVSCLPISSTKTLDELGTQTKKWWDYRLRFATNDFATNPLAVVSGPTVFWTSDQHRTQSDPFLRWPDVSEGFVQLLRTVAWNVLGQNVPTKGTTNLTVVDGNLQAIRFQRQILLTHWTFKPNGRTLCSTTSYRHLLSVELSAMLSSRGANPD